MKSLVATAVFGLLPLPPMDDKNAQEPGRPASSTGGEFDRTWTHAGPPPSYLERMATKAELAQLREQLRSIGRH